MTFHSHPKNAFGVVFDQISGSLLGGQPLQHSADLIRSQLGASAVAMRVQEGADIESAIVIVSADEAGDDVPGNVLDKLLDTYRNTQAVTVNDNTALSCSLWIFRNAGDAGAFAEDTTICEILVSLLRRGVELSARIGNHEIERTLYSDVMDRLAVGVLILDRAGNVVKCTDSARELLSEADGLGLQGGRLRASYSGEDRKFQQAIKVLTRAVVDGDTPETCGLSLTRPSGKRSLGILIQPIAGAERAGPSSRPCLAIYLRDPSAVAEMRSELMRQLFDLTPAEAAVAGRLTAGLSLEDAASSLDISRNTARAHLRSIFSKSGITRQTELVRLLLSSAVILGEKPCQAAA